ncbi:Bug family tripartite tricarboxylate transporter substrate binding protein [Ramlibacter sp.]|uniref:Bug family tripartite tricarboxylate transporter substrate binding protein n=1 Tax=Ramlibacter sp. TaxID=1917967 RepID=UPI003D135BEB
MTASLLTRRRFVRAFGAAGLFVATAAEVTAQPSRPVRIILPVAAGSGVDTLTRAASQALSRSLGHPVVIENQPGAGGIIGTQALVKSAPDGYTLSIVSSNHVVYPSVLKAVPFDAVGDVTPIAVIGSAPMILVANPKIPATNARELIALMKAKPDAFNYASSGSGTLPHLAAAMFVDEAGVKARHIPYKGAGPMLTDLIGGQVDFGVLALGAIHPHLKSGALRAIGTASAQRSAAAPEIPTFREQGLANYVVDAWFAVIGPKGMSQADVMRIHSALVSTFAAPEVKEAMDKQGNMVALTTPEQAHAYFRSELAKYAALVKKAGVEPQ